MPIKVRYMDFVKWSGSHVRTFEVQITSRKQMFMNILQLTSLPLYVSPFFISMSIGWPSAVFNKERGNMINKY